ncbi:BA14K family protein [Xanthobacteraceae bacterium Astr-EGSB]|uniref:BA14K family protein n=1 Tax=Astrobacterium formosum TaxID=3069710 RepID=UPI0027AF6F85|nr:BA14K family protein [Xanthobacteraceae bacterium Astr-EGSB]
MMISSKILAALLTVAVAPLFAGPAAATPISTPLALQNAATPSVEMVQYRRGGYRGGHYGGYRGGHRGRGYGGAGLGIVAGALIGSAIVGATQPYGYGGRPGYVVAPGGDAVAYCAQRFRSYDPGSGTYLGYDGLRHPCP